MKHSISSFLAAVILSSTVITAQGVLITDIKKVMGTTASSDTHPLESVNDNVLSTYYKASATSFGWVGYDLGAQYVINQIAFCCPKGYSSKMQLGIFEGANNPDFSDALPLYMIKEAPAEEKLLLKSVKCSKGFRYVRYVGTASSNCVIAEMRFYGNKGAGNNTRLYQFSNIPVVTIHTKAGGDIVSKTEYQEGIVSVISDDGTGFFSDSLDVRGRGNGSWVFDQKPYKMKLRHKARLLDMKAKAKKWLLISDYREKTLMRNTVGYEANRMFGAPYTAQIRMVDVMLNGEYKGIYQLTDQIEVNKNRINVTKMTPEDIEQPELSGGYLLEIDNYASGEPVHFFSSKFGTPINVHHPKDEITTPQFNYIQRYYDRLENRTFSYNCKDPLYGIPSILNVDSYLRRFIVGEFTANSDDWHQVFLFKERNDPRFHFAPIWDLDLGLDNRGALYPTNTKFNDYLYKSGSVASAAGMVSMVTRNIGVYEEEIQQIWSDMRNNKGFNGDYFDNFIDSIAEHLEASQKLHFTRWPVLDVVCINTAVARGSYKAEVDYLKDFVRKRIEWLDNRIGLLPSGVNKPQGIGHIEIDDRLIKFKNFPIGTKYQVAGVDGVYVKISEITSEEEDVSVAPGLYCIKLQEKDGNETKRTVMIQ